MEYLNQPLKIWLGGGVEPQHNIGQLRHSRWRVYKSSSVDEWLASDYSEGEAELG